MDISITLGYRRLIANAVCKLQTPNSKVTFLQESPDDQPVSFSNKSILNQKSRRTLLDFSPTREEQGDESLEDFTKLTYEHDDDPCSENVIRTKHTSEVLSPIERMLRQKHEEISQKKLHSKQPRLKRRSLWRK